MKYPLLENESESLKATSGRPVAEITLDATATLSEDDLRIRAETLRAQARVAREAGYKQLAANLTRAAELTAVPNDELLKMYDFLRPGRASYETLIALAERLETLYAAPETGRFIREAAAVYKERNLLRREV
jgi:propanediol dehydratase small subunit